MSAYKKSVDLGLTGTDAEKVAVLKSLSSNNISAVKVRGWLFDNNLLKWDGISYSGAIETVAAGLPPGHQTLTDITDLKAIVFHGTRDNLRSSEPAHAPRIFAFVSAVAAGNSALLDAFYALDGGRPYKELTVEQFAAQRTELQNAAAAAAALQEVDQAYATAANAEINPALSADNRTKASIAAALRAAADVMEA